jgi:hypothetical protein
MRVVPRALSVAVVAGTLVVACASHNTTPSASGDGTTGTGTGLPTTGDYPAGPFGLSVGDVFPRIRVNGYKNGTGGWTALDTLDYFDPNGARGINGVYVTVSAPWCSGCKLEGAALPRLYEGQYKARGGRILTVLLQDAAYEPASQGTADAWVAAYATPYDLAVGDVGTMLPPKGSGSISLPYNYAIDPRSMRIVAIDSGDYFQGDAIPGLDQVLAANKK